MRFWFHRLLPFGAALLFAGALSCDQTPPDTSYECTCKLTCDAQSQVLTYSVCETPDSVDPAR